MKKEIRCPKCDKVMMAELHAPEDGAKWITSEGENITEEKRGRLKEMREMDNWWCPNCEILVDRDDLKVFESIVKMYKKGI